MPVDTPPPGYSWGWAGAPPPPRGPRQPPGPPVLPAGWAAPSSEWPRCCPGRRQPRRPRGSAAAAGAGTASSPPPAPGTAAGGASVGLGPPQHPQNREVLGQTTAGNCPEVPDPGSLTHRAAEGLLPAVDREFPGGLLAFVKGHGHGHQPRVATALAESLQVLQQARPLQERLERGEGSWHHHDVPSVPLPASVSPLTPKSHFQVLKDATDGDDHVVTGEDFEVLPQHLLRRQPWEVTRG